MDNLKVWRVANGWIVASGQKPYIATTPAEAAEFVRRWAENHEHDIRDRTPLDPPSPTPTTTSVLTPRPCDVL